MLRLKYYHNVGKCSFTFKKCSFSKHIVIVGNMTCDPRYDGEGEASAAGCLSQSYSERSDPQYLHFIAWALMVSAQ